uniref:Ig-like domain-containing protein n=1 Tax=Paramormyrops kingsleyae TaxID=1676925 RepID=A0A3B3SYP2_9TELE
MFFCGIQIEHYRCPSPLLSLFVSLTVPTDVSARLGEPATLPCYVPVDKTQRSNTDTVHWEKDGQTVLLLQSGSSNKSSGFENRYSMSVDKVRFGDLSLTISKVRYSDQGTYQCFSTEKTVKPDIINLIIEGRVHSNTLFIFNGIDKRKPERNKPCKLQRNLLRLIGYVTGLFTKELECSCKLCAFYLTSRTGSLAI